MRRDGRTRRSWLTEGIGEKREVTRKGRREELAFVFNRRRDVPSTDRTRGGREKPYAQLLMINLKP